MLQYAGLIFWYLPAMDLASLFPPQVAWVIATPEMWKTPVFPEEETLISQAMEKRKGEFRAGRHCAHTAMQKLGGPGRPILRDDKRAPVWPTGFLGSISHTSDFCLAACASSEQLVGLGVDVEPLAPLKQGVDRYIHSTAENAFMQSHPHLPERLIFSAKESLYKCFYPLLKRYVGFHAVEIIVDSINEQFRYRPSNCTTDVPFPSHLRFYGRFLITTDHLLTCAYLTLDD